MKSLVKLALAFVLGIFVTMTFVLPKFQTTPAPAEPAPTPDIQAEIQKAVETAVTEAIALTAVKTEQEIETPEMAETAEPEEPAQEAETEPKPTPTPEPAAKPTEETAQAKPQTTSPSQATPAPEPKKAAEPEYFYENGKKYAYINGIKSHIADEADSVQLGSYDWENDPAGQIKGPFN